jgi:predicted alpha/beta-fold hydrolase
MAHQKISLSPRFTVSVTSIQAILVLVVGCCSNALAFMHHGSQPIVGSMSLTPDRHTETSTSIGMDEIQRKSAAIISSFELAEQFDPKISNGHVQSILGFFLRKSCSYVPRNESPIDLLQRIQKGFQISSKESDNAAYWDKRERIETPDGDWFHVDYKYTSNSKPTTSTTQPTPTVLLLHGLQSSSYGNLSVEMARAFKHQGLNVIALNFRGCSKDENGNNIPNDTLGAYHLGFTNDLLHFMNIFRQREPMTPIYLAGFSLGANVVLKCLGDLAERAVEYNIQGAATLCAPLDQLRNAPVLAQPFSIQRYVYTNSLLKSLKRKAQAQLERLQAFDVVSIDRIMSAETITEFDDAFIAPIYGFKDCWDYYRQTSPIHVLDEIAVPTLVLNALDDPFLDSEVWPVEKSCENGGPAPLKMIHCKSGGHLGFIFHQVDDNDMRIGSTAPSFASHTAAQFLDHVHTTYMHTTHQQM